MTLLTHTLLATLSPTGAHHVALRPHGPTSLGGRA